MQSKGSQGASHKPFDRTKLPASCTVSPSAGTMEKINVVTLLLLVVGWHLSGELAGLPFHVCAQQQGHFAPEGSSVCAWFTCFVPLHVSLMVGTCFMHGVCAKRSRCSCCQGLPLPPRHQAQPAVGALPSGRISGVHSRCGMAQQAAGRLELT